MMGHAQYLRQAAHAKLWKATHPAQFADTLIVDSAIGQSEKADERYSAGSDLHELGHAVVLWLCCVLLAVIVPALALHITWVDVLTWLTDAADAIARIL